MSDITVIKNDHTGKEVWRYEGVVLEQSDSHVKLEARFNRGAIERDFVTFERGDRFVEWFYADRWYNIFEVHDVTDDRIKGWYCNIVRPAKIADGQVMQDDLALDVWITPDLETMVMDRDEFEGLGLAEGERKAALNALADLLGRVERGEAPFGR